MTRISILTLLFVVTTITARVPSTKTVLSHSPGVRGDITIPWTTNGISTLGVYQGVAPRVIASPLLHTPEAPKRQNVYNFIFYGSKLGPSAAFDGPTARPANDLRGGR